MTTHKDILVYESINPKHDFFIGTVHVDNVRGKEIFSFDYDPGWLKQHRLSIDPNLQMYSGRQYASPNLGNFGFLLDSCPDRWGRLLMDRRELIISTTENRKPKKLLESDYLLGVCDDSRMGALRFKTDSDGEFLSNSKDLAIPPWVRLRELEQAVRNFENEKSSANYKWLRQLISPGSSLGGARPKANVRDEKNNLWIAKFPSKHDEFDVGAWEMVTHDLARMCDLNVVDAKSQKFSEYGTTFIIKRFDRKTQAYRKHFASAMSMLGHKDGESIASYLEIVDFLNAFGSKPQCDIHELWRRIVFNICVSNTDDHLRNHGFLLERDGWKLSPMYDVNPNVYGEFLSLAITESDNRANLDVAIMAAKYYGLENAEAEEKVNTIKDIVCGSWKDLAHKYQIPKSEIERMLPAFIQ